MTNKRTFISLIIFLIFFCPLFSYGQHVSAPADKRQMHRETVSDPYLPNAYNNKKVSPPYRYKGNNASRPLNSSIVTVQVNVDASGQNIIGDAGNEPNLAVNPLNPNFIVIGWRQFDNVTSNFRQAGWSYSSDGGLTWTFPGEIQQGIFRSDPVLDYDMAGNFYYNSLTLDTNQNYSCDVFLSSNGGAAWNSGTPAAGGDKQWMTIDRSSGVGNGNIYTSWNSSYTSCPPNQFTRSTNGGSSYENCTFVDGDPYWGTMAVGNAGELYICGADPIGLIVAKSLNAQTAGSTINWNTPVSVDMDGQLNGWLPVNPVGLIGQSNIDVDRSNGAGQGNVYLMASMSRLSNSDPADVMFARSEDGGLTWISPLRLNDDQSLINYQWIGTMSVAPNGRIDAVWLDTRDAPSGSDSSALYYSWSNDQGNSWSVNERLSPLFDPHVGYPNQSKMGDYFDMISDNYGAHLAWSNTLNGEEDVYYSHIVPPIVTGTPEFSNNIMISVFPNPTNGLFEILNPSKQSLAEVFSPLGEKVYSKKFFKSLCEVDLSNISSGVYFLKVSNEDGSIAIKKIIKQ